MKNNDWTRLEEGAAGEYLEKLGLTQALDSFLFTPDMYDLYHVLYVGSCDGLKACIQDMPECVRETLMKRMDGYEDAESFFIDAAIEEFKAHLATLLAANEYTLGDVSGIVQCYKDALEGSSKHLENLAMELAGESLDYMIQAYKKTWLTVLRDVEDQEDKKVILKAALGDDIPDLEHCVVIEVDASKMFGDDEEEGDTEE